MESFGSSVVPVIRYSIAEPDRVDSRKSRFDQREARPGSGFHAREVLDLLAVEEPLVLVAVTATGESVPLGLAMRTPGDDHALATGFLASEGVITSANQVARFADEVSGCGRRAVTRLSVHLATGVDPGADALEAWSIRSSSCGLCGRTAVEQIMGRTIPIADSPESATVAPKTLCLLPDTLAETQTVFHRTGGLHAAALFSAEGELLSMFEDIGRHNAVDKVVGAAMLGQVGLTDKILMLSGRAGFELIQKAATVGIPVVASIGAPSSLAVELAGRANLTLAGFVRRTGFNLYAGGKRIARDFAAVIDPVDR
jgi:FdhD protein